MRASADFIFRQVADEYLLVPVGDAARTIKGLIAMSESGGLLYQQLQNGCTKEVLVQTLLSEYEVSGEQADADVDEFLTHMRRLGILVED